MPNQSITIAQAIARYLRQLGVARIFGIPGGGSSLDLIDAAQSLGIQFVLARTESAAVIMAACSAELSGVIGVALTGVGPGLANAVNGIAYASLDRAPVLIIADGIASQSLRFVTHQRFDQLDLVVPITKSRARIDAGNFAVELPRIISAAMAPPLGPVLLELDGVTAAQTAGALGPVETATLPDVDSDAIEQGQRLLHNSRRPVIIAGLECTSPAGVLAVRGLHAQLDCPVFTTYKAKGVVADFDPRCIGLFTGGSAESKCIAGADLIVMLGLDPVELIPQDWRYDAPILELAHIPYSIHYVKAALRFTGDWEPAIEHWCNTKFDNDWTAAELSEYKNGMRARIRNYTSTRAAAKLTAPEVIDTALEIFGGDVRVTIDAGAHMFSAIALWPAANTGDVLISNGLASMAFALPAAIAAALHDPSRAVVTFIGDGGLLMCLGELATAAELEVNLTIVVFNDSALSLIDIKQQQRGFPTTGVRWNEIDLAACAAGFDIMTMRARSLHQYRDALRRAAKISGPVLLDVRIDPTGYRQQLRALRG
ncbi:MAG: thiamine pyrophosphate-binding protein [Gammaproteobacteria bacterium]|nr:thiamine pyrophosphate-binding protein [Gammaproteobacteria bacterium]MDH3466528.1 thiamine pyrophosphate-binding protein [Gammaproteobacteria bacterium]